MRNTEIGGQNQAGGGKKVMGVLWKGGGVGNMGLGRAGGFGEKDIWAGPRPI